MGCHYKFDIDKYPVQTKYLGKRVKVCFHYNTSEFRIGTICRDDYGEPGLTLIFLEDGRIVTPAECQYSFIDDDDPVLKEYRGYHFQVEIQP